MKLHLKLPLSFRFLLNNIIIPKKENSYDKIINTTINSEYLKTKEAQSIYFRKLINIYPNKTNSELIKDFVRKLKIFVHYQVQEFNLLRNNLKNILREIK